MQCQFAMPVGGYAWGVQKCRSSMGKDIPASLFDTNLAGVYGEKGGSRRSITGRVERATYLVDATSERADVEIGFSFLCGVDRVLRRY